TAGAHGTTRSRLRVGSNSRWNARSLTGSSSPSTRSLTPRRGSMRLLLRRAWYLWRHRQLEHDLAEEIAFHRALKQQELEAGGLKPTDAGIATRRALGSVALAQDQVRDVWQAQWLQGTGRDLRLASRTLRMTPIVTTVAVVSLALGIGANTAMFSLVSSVMLRSLPVPNPG